MPLYDFVAFRPTLNDFFEKRMANEKAGKREDGIERFVNRHIQRPPVCYADNLQILGAQERFQHGWSTWHAARFAYRSYGEGETYQEDGRALCACGGTA